MDREIPAVDPPLTAEDEAEIAKLSEPQIEIIDNALLSYTSEQWRKVAMVVALTMSSMPDIFGDIPDLYYAERVRKFLNDGVLESQGNLTSMRFAEVRLNKHRSP